MLTFFTIVHVLLCVFMIFVILLQPGKDAGMGAALGGGAATSAFGGRGAVTFLSKVTAVCAGLFFLTSLGLSFVGLRTSVVSGEPVTKPVAPINAAASPGKTEDKGGTPIPAQGVTQPEGTAPAAAPVQQAPTGAPVSAPAPGAPPASSGTAPAGTPGK